MDEPDGSRLRVVELVDPILKTQIAVAVNSTGPGSPAARAFVASAQQLALDEFFAKRLGGIYRR